MRAKKIAKKSLSDRSKRLVNRLRYAKRFRDTLIPELIDTQKKVIITYLWMLGVPALLGIIYWMVFQLPEEYVATREKQYPSPLSLKEHLDALNTTRTSMLTLLSGSAVFIGAYLTLRNVAAAEKNVSLSREGQITDRFIKAVEKLGSDKLEMRLGGIYSLERIARDSERDHWPIMEILTAFVREHAPFHVETHDPNQAKSVRPRADIEAIMTVLRRRNWNCEQKGQRIDLRHADLRQADLSDTCLVDALFCGSLLDNAIFDKSDLERADFSNCILSRTRFSEAFLQEAIFNDSSLSEVDLDGANLEHSWFMNAKIKSTSALRVQGRESTFLKATLSDSDFGVGDFQYANFKRATIEDVSFHGSNMEGAKFEGVITSDPTIGIGIQDTVIDSTPTPGVNQTTGQPVIQTISKK